MREIDRKGILAIPGQLLTLGGALTSRIEWFSRQSNGGRSFNKRLAHQAVREVVAFLLSAVLDLAKVSGLTPYEAMLRCASGQEEIAEGSR
jgi:hypothetical protein